MGESVFPRSGVKLSAGSLCPSDDVLAEPHLAPSPTEVNDWARHVGVAMLVQRNSVALGLPEQVRDLL